LIQLSNEVLEISLPEYEGETSNYSCQTRGKGILECLRSRWMWRRKAANNCQVVFLSRYNICITLCLKKIIVEMKVLLPLYFPTCSLMNLYQGFDGISYFLLQVIELSLASKTVTFIEKISHWLLSPTVAAVRSWYL